ncbi:hypothetical protein C8Q75DRAFT_112098 [Abortiporus biennis]|nr:hypothetical protein C8Q75DRAFT_112098 [Abortiporus biennis]
MQPVQKPLQNNQSSNHSDTHPEQTTARTVKPAPVQNVWSTRIEQMKARAISQPHSAALPTVVQESSHVATISTPTETISTDNTSMSAPELSSSNSAHTTPPTPLSVNGHHADDHHHDPFVVRPHLAPPTRISLPVVDSENWPTVGSSASPPERPSSNGNIDVNTGGDNVKMDENSHKKDEKTKWVPIPAEELQVAADAHQRNRPPRHTQTHSQYQNSSRGSTRPVSGPASTSGSISGQNSQGQSRTHSVAGVRQGGSRAGSVSNSQAQSRTGSVHSSPRQSSIRGGKRLHDDIPLNKVTESLSPTNRSIHSSRVTSPQSQPHSLPAAAPPPSSDLFISQSPHTGVEQAYIDVGQCSPYYQSIPPPFSGPASRSYDSTHASNSPTSNQYALPAPGSAVYTPPPIPGNISPHPGFPGVSQYPVYPPFYYTAPYLPWVPGQEPPPHMYPITSPVHLGSTNPPYPLPTNAATSPDGLPPVTLIERPPPPSESDGVAGYRNVDFVAAPVTSQADESEGERGRRGREFSFGSIKPTTPNKTPSPAPQVPAVVVAEAGSAAPTESDNQNELAIEKSFASFSIGVMPGEPGPSRIRARTRTTSRHAASSHERLRTAPARLGADTSTNEDTVNPASAESTDTKIVDLTESKWEFGTTGQVASADIEERHGMPQSNTYRPLSSNNQSLNIRHAPIAPAPRLPPQPPVMYEISSGLVPMAPHPSYSPTVSHSPSSGPYPAPEFLPPNAATEGAGDEWQVKNFGYGFGRGNGGVGVVSGPPPVDDRIRGREPREIPRDYQPGRPRRGSYSANRGGHERGGYSGRRGRGGNAYGGRGYTVRGYSRGGYQYNQQRPPFAVTQPMPPPPPPEHTTYYPPPPISLQSGTTYFHPPGYDPYAYTPYPPPMPVTTPSQPVPPVPTPITIVPFPLDHVRYYLLGQLEYYFSEQNLPRDFYLRQQMDSRGWIHIPLIASFERVKSLTLDLQLVQDVLALSSLVEVRDDYVRIHRWERYILPTAAKSVVEDTGSHTSTQEHQDIHHHPGDDSADTESTSHEDEDEEDIEFVLGDAASATANRD